VTAEGTVGRRLQDIGRGQWNIPALLAQLRRVVTQGQTLEDFEVEHEFDRVGRRTVILDARLVTSVDSTPALMLLAIEDVSDRVRSREEALRHREELAHVMRTATLGELAAGLVHELSQPLNALVTTLETCTLQLNAGKTDRRTLVPLVREANGDAVRLAKVLGHMRDYVRRRSPKLEEIDLREVVKRVGTLMQGEARRQRVVLRLDPGRQALVVRTDAIQIEQVMANLVQNGIDSISLAGRKQRQVTVRAYVNDVGMAEVAVTDTGPGFSGTVADRIFEPFFTTKPKGLGMGLSISRSIVEAHGGRLWIVGGEHGVKGTTVRMSLPRFLGTAKPGRKAQESRRRKQK
jgi:C4-dicarboxylate-specific signal transduction histidine kinase